MSSRLAFAFCIVLVLVGLGFLAQRVLLSDAPTETTEPEDLVFLLPDDAAPDGATPNQHSTDVEILSVTGKVERQSAEGVWEPVRVGDKLSADDRIRTGEDGAAEVDVGQVAVVRLDSNSLIAVPAITRIPTVRLGSGRIAAEVPGTDGRGFKVDVAGSDTEAETEKGAFSVLKSPEGVTAVATKTGKVRLTAKKKTVVVAAGEQSIVHSNAAPSAPTKIPPSLFVKLRKSSLIQRRPQFVVRGQTQPGAVIRINGVAVKVDESGEFTRALTLREGANNIKVESNDALGRNSIVTRRVRLKSKGSEVKGEMKWGN